MNVLNFDYALTPQYFLKILIFALGRAITSLFRILNRRRGGGNELVFCAELLEFLAGLAPGLAWFGWFGLLWFIGSMHFVQKVSTN